MAISRYSLPRCFSGQLRRFFSLSSIENIFISKYSHKLLTLFKMNPMNCDRRSFEEFMLTGHRGWLLSLVVFSKLFIFSCEQHLLMIHITPILAVWKDWRYFPCRQLGRWGPQRFHDRPRDPTAWCLLTVWKGLQHLGMINYFISWFNWPVFCVLPLKYSTVLSSTMLRRGSYPFSIPAASLPPVNLTRISLSMYRDKSKILSFFFSFRSAGLPAAVTDFSIF